ncbi:MAG: hypothetical protein V4449_00115 [Patescibacteria group bacterium]
MSDSIKDTGNQANGNPLSISASFHLGHLLSNGHHAFVVRKSERLASALYVITGFIPADEPVRGRLRVCALDLLNRSTDQNKLHGAGIESFGARCMEIGTILEAAKAGGLVSSMNAKLICDEYASLASFVRDHQEKISERASGVEGSLSEIEKPAISSIGHSMKSPLRPIEINKKISIAHSPEKRQSDRRGLVLSAFKNNGKFSIKDITSLVEGCSEKTVQRELLALVQSGILIKEGERRWSTYRKA